LVIFAYARMYIAFERC